MATSALFVVAAEKSEALGAGTEAGGGVEPPPSASGEAVADGAVDGAAAGGSARGSAPEVGEVSEEFAWEAAESILENLSSLFERQPEKKTTSGMPRANQDFTKRVWMVQA